MPEIDDLDRAFAALAHDVMGRTFPPPARAAIRRARLRRRTTLAVAAAAAAVVVGGVAVPTVGAERLGIGFADRLPDPAPLDAAALGEATDGWISGWTTGMSDDTFTAPDCFPRDDRSVIPETGGTSQFSGTEQSGATMVLEGYPDAEAARAGWDARLATWSTCVEASRTGTPSYPPGTEVVHYRLESAAESGTALSDVWVARTGADVAVLETFTATGVADGSAVDAVSDTLVAGMLDGSLQEEWDPAFTYAPQRPQQLPSYDERDLREALGAWHGSGRVDAMSLPVTPCLPSLDRGGAASSSSSPSGKYIALYGYAEDGTRAGDELARAVEALRDCGSVQQQPALAGGVVLFTYDVGGLAGHGAVWLAAHQDRVMVVSVDGVAKPMPEEVGPRVATFVTDVLAQPWPEPS